MKAILKKEYLTFKNAFISYLTIWTLFPMAIYLLVSIPLSFSISLPSGINYLNWSSVGNWVLTSTFISLFVSLNSLSKYQSKESSSRFMLYGPTSIGEHLVSIMLVSILFGLAQLFFSMLITLSLRSSNLFFLDLLTAVLYIIPIILFVSNLGILIGLLLDSLFIRLFTILFFMIYIFFTSGVFIPLSSNLPIFFRMSPLYMSISNIQSIMTNDPTSISSSFLIVLISIFLFVVNFMLFKRFLGKKF